jgi:hypothetical protein
MPWLLLTATLPAAPSALRVRVWRALKATGAASLREGVFLLPEHAPTAAALAALERTIVEAGAPAHLLVVDARDAEQQRQFEALFDRSDAHAELLQRIREARGVVPQASDAELRKTLRTLEQQASAIAALDFFPGRAARKTAEALATLRRQVALHLAPGEPAAAPASAIVQRDVAEHQGRTWATRRRPWVDRLATAWLVTRFIDRAPRFVWLADPARCPKKALGFDFDGATFTHVGDKVTFEVMAESFGLLQHDPALRQLAALVHAIDVGGIPADEAAGLELVVRGLQARHASDDALLAAALPVFDACHAAYATTDTRHDDDAR